MVRDPDYAPASGLAAEWSLPRGADTEALLQRTRLLFEQISPGNLFAVRPLVDAVLQRLALRSDRPAAREAVRALLETVRRRRFLEEMTPELAAGWAPVLISAVDAADYSVGELLAARERTDPGAVAIRALEPEPRDLTVAEVARRSRAIARGLLQLLDGAPEGRVALLAENGAGVALSDLACLTSGIVDVPLPANSTPSQVEYMLRHCRAQVAIVSDEEQAAKVLPLLHDLPQLRHVVLIGRAAAERHGLLSLRQLEARGEGLPDAPRRARAEAVRSADLATILYTSGTTGVPKGIGFSQLNLMSKRFCRALALPTVGEGDVFLCYLPLFHTFGRYLELLGSLFWGATYVFARSPARAILFEDFARVRPTVFISVPKKWTELYEQAIHESNGEGGERAAEELRRITGGRLRLGLSAAGWLDPHLFHAARWAGIELLSGYGMTESTGGVTMTPPGGYVDDSIGLPLPGIELAITSEGELRLRGPYLMTGYVDPPDGDSGLDAEGWFSTGDLVARDERGYLFITGRKKEIYKNRKGQTIAPQRVENLFRGLEPIGQAFLVGDRREFNTLLVWPNYEGQPALREKPPEELRALIGSLVASANRFLAPFERVVSFELLPRPLSEAEGELTPKHTFRREIIERHFAALIEPMYQAQHVAFRLDGHALHVPNWLLRELGVLREDLALGEGRLHAPGRSLAVAFRPGPGGKFEVQIGDYLYRGAGPALDLGALLATPSLWFGNEELRTFLGQTTFLALISRRREPAREFEVHTREAPPLSTERTAELEPFVEQSEVAPAAVHAAAALLRGGIPLDRAAKVVSWLEQGAARGRPDLAELCRAILRRGLEHSDPAVARLALQALLAVERPEEAETSLRRFVEHGEVPSGAVARASLASVPAGGGSPSATEASSARELPAALLASLLELLHQHAERPEEPIADPATRRLIVATMRLLAAHAIAHPLWYAAVRVPLARLALHGDVEVAARAGEELDRLQLGFRAWIGPNLRLAMDPETGREYGWHEALAFEPWIDGAHRTLLERAITETSLVRESIFLFGKGTLLCLEDLPPGGARVTPLASKHGKSVYRLSLQARSGESFDVAVNVADTLPVTELRDEVRWLQSAGTPPPLVEAFGGYYPEHGIFTEEYIPGETIENQLTRLARTGAQERLLALWPFHVWTALALHLGFWDRTGRRLAIADPCAGSVIVPSHDYQVGSRLVSIGPRVPCRRPEELLGRFRDRFLAPVLAERPELRGVVGPKLLYAAFLEGLGTRGAQLLEQIRPEAEGEPLAEYLEELRRDGYTPLRLHFAERRYERWISVTPEATVEARGAMLQELWGTYGLEALEERWPDTRVRFFRQTVFARARPPIAEALDRLMAALRSGEPVDLAERAGALMEQVRPEEDERYFLARLTYRHLRPGDQAVLISRRDGGRQVTDVVLTLTDTQGGRFLVRGPVSPREVARLLQLFDEANLPVRFGAEHELLLALDERLIVIGGLFYRMIDGERAHLEKIVVARPYRKKGIADALVHELVQRLRVAGVKVVETGYFHPQYMGRFGFRTEPNYGGLVRDLEGSAG